MKKAVILGVGPLEGLGGALCLRFAREGLHVFVAGRSGKKLEKVVEEITNNGNVATSVVTDATSDEDIKNLFEVAQNTGHGDVELAIYNAGNNTPGKISEMDSEYFENSWRVGCFGGFLFAREAIRRHKEEPLSLLFTGASASLRGRAGFGAFNSAKGALRNLAQALAKECAESGIHVGHVVVDGPIWGEKIKVRYPEWVAEKGEEAMISLDGLTDAYFYLYKQRRRAWTFEIDLRTSLERW